MNRGRTLLRLVTVGIVMCGTIPATAAADDPALLAVEACRARLDARVDIGIERVRRRCPELLPALETAPWREMLPSTLGARREDISAGSLKALAELVRHRSDAGAGRSAPDPEALAEVLAGLGDLDRRPTTRWQRFTRWLKEKYADSDRDDEDGWLEKLARKLRTSEGVAQAITYLGYALVVGLVLWVIWAELKAAGLLGGDRRAARRAGPVAEWRRRLLLADVLAAPLAERPGMLLRLLGEALSRAQRLPPADGLTVGAFVQRARLDAEAERVALARVAGTAEQVRYAARAPGDEAIEEAVSTARDLLGKFAHLPESRR
jgi:hypothetical protein